MATDKSQNQEWPFAEVSGCASSPVVKQAWRVVCGGARACIPCALARRALCVAATTTSSFSSTGAVQGVRHHLACRRPRRRRRGDLRAAARHALCNCCSHIPSAHGPHRLWIAAACAQLLAAGMARVKWQIQKWPFATVSASVARGVVSLCYVCCVWSVHERRICTVLYRL